MNRPGYNPTRRNRKIGTGASGYGQDNRMVIPAAWTADRMFYERLVDPVEIPVQVGGVSTLVLVEPPQSGFVHACTVDDLIGVLGMLPASHIERIEMFVMRQPKRKERIISPVWGRLVYWSEIGEHSGPAVYLEAQEADLEMKWTKSLKPDRALELERLRSDGHQIESDKRNHLIRCSLDSIRNTQLYRTLPHEVGHYVDFLTKVEEPSRDDSEKWLDLNERYHARPSQEKEAFAHRYADEFRDAKTSGGRLPFDRLLDPKMIKRLGMEPAWFGGHGV